ATAPKTEATLVQQGASPAATLLPGDLAKPDAVSQAQDASISDQVTKIQNQVTPLQTAYQKANEDAYKTWKTLTVQNPKDPAIWFEFANAAVNAAQGGTTAADVTTAKDDAITGFKKFLELAPGDPLAPQVKSAGAQLEGKTAPTPAATAIARAGSTATGTAGSGSTSTTK